MTTDRALTEVIVRMAAAVAANNGSTVTMTKADVCAIGAALTIPQPDSSALLKAAEAKADKFIRLHAKALKRADKVAGWMRKTADQHDKTGTIADKLNALTLRDWIDALAGVGAESTKELK